MPNLRSKETGIVRIAVLDLGRSQFGRSATDLLATRLKEKDFSTVDRDLARAAAHGVGYQGSLNLSRSEARDLGAALGSEFFVLGDVETIKRSPSQGDSYFESYASIFVVSSRTGNLVNWSRQSFKSATTDSSEKLLLNDIAGAQLIDRLSVAIQRAQEDEENYRATAPTFEAVMELAPADEKEAEANGVRLPRPFRRIRPTYTDDAANADAEATVDVLVDIDEKGAVKHVEIERWAGFGLDQACLEIVRQLSFFPAMRGNDPIPMRVLLRYNFRKPPKTT